VITMRPMKTGQPTLVPNRLELAALAPYRKMLTAQTKLV
jgi:hypothetical protein